jgi:hypothetical protein
MTTTHIALEFTKQKNGVQGEIVSLGQSGHNLLCPVLAMIHRIRHFRLHHAPQTTPIYTYYTHNSSWPVTTTTLTQHLRYACHALG